MILCATDIIKNLEGYKNKVYIDTAGKRTIGYGWNLDDPSAKQVFNAVVTDNFTEFGYFLGAFQEIYDGDIDITPSLAEEILDRYLHVSYTLARHRAEELGIDLDKEPFWRKVIVTDIAFNTGSCEGWTRVFKVKTPRACLAEARRKQRELDSRVAKLGYQLGIIADLEEAHMLGLTEAKYIR